MCSQNSFREVVVLSEGVWVSQQSWCLACVGRLCLSGGELSTPAAASRRLRGVTHHFNLTAETQANRPHKHKQMSSFIKNRQRFVYSLLC